MRPRLPKFNVRGVPSRATGAWPRATYNGELSNARLEVPSGDVTVDIAGAHWLHVDLSGQRIANYVATDSVFESCDYSRCNFEGGLLGAIPLAIYRDCLFRNADLRYCSPQYARFERCRFIDANLADWRAVNAEFVDCVFDGRLLRLRFSATPVGAGADRIRRLRAANEFHGNDFSKAELIDCSFSGGINLDANTWPASPEYVVIRAAAQRIAAARTRLNELPEESRPTAGARLDVFSLMYADQPDILVRRVELGPVVDLLLATEVGQP